MDTLTPAEISGIIEYGESVNRDIERLKREKKRIEEQLVAAALAAEHIPLADSEREGKQALLATERGAILPVIFESDMLVQSMPWGGDLHRRLEHDWSSCSLDRFYREKRVLENAHRDGKAFRAHAREVFSPDNAERFIAGCLWRDRDGIPRSRVVIAWDRLDLPGGTAR